MSEAPVMMAVLKPRRTGLPFEIWISESEYASTQHHRPRLKVFSKQKNVDASVAFDDPIEVLAGTAITGPDWKALTDYIALNRQSLMQLWNGEIDQVTYVQNQQLVDDQDELFEMANILPRDAGLKQRVWISINLRQ